MENNKINSNDLTRDLANYCLDMIKYIYRIDIDGTEKINNYSYYLVIRSGIERVISDIEKRLNEDAGGLSNIACVIRDIEDGLKEKEE